MVSVHEIQGVLVFVDCFKFMVEHPLSYGFQKYHYLLGSVLFTLVCLEDQQHRADTIQNGDVGYVSAV